MILTNPRVRLLAGPIVLVLVLFGCGDSGHPLGQTNGGNGGAAGATGSGGGGRGGSAGATGLGGQAGGASKGGTGGVATGGAGGGTGGVATGGAGGAATGGTGGGSGKGGAGGAATGGGSGKGGAGGAATGGTGGGGRPAEVVVAPAARGDWRQRRGLRNRRIAAAGLHGSDLRIESADRKRTEPRARHHPVRVRARSERGPMYGLHLWRAAVRPVRRNLHWIHGRERADVLAERLTKRRRIDPSCRPRSESLRARAKQITAHSAF